VPVYNVFCTCLFIFAISLFMYIQALCMVLHFVISLLLKIFPLQYFGNFRLSILKTNAKNAFFLFICIFLFLNPSKVFILFVAF